MATGHVILYIHDEGHLDEYDSIAVIIADEHQNNNEDYWASLFDEMFGDVPEESILTRLVEIIDEIVK